MKVLILSNSFSGGGAEKAMTILHRELLNLGITSMLCALMLSETFEDVEGGVQLSRQWKSGLVSTFSNFMQYRKVLRKFNPDYVIANCELSELYVSLTPYISEKVIVVEHTTFPWNNRRITGAFVRLILKLKSIDWATVSKRSNVIWPYGQSASYMPNPIDSKNIITAEATDMNLRGLVTIGRLAESKRTEWVLALGRDLELPVTVIGDGILRNQLEKNFPEASFLGFQENPWEKLRDGQLLIVPSDFEGDGLVVAEAISQGFPLLLRRTKDFETFNLPTASYFYNEPELKERIVSLVKDGLESCYPPKPLVLQLLDERDSQKVALRWINLLKTKSLK
jgi:hypothetical protein